MQVRLGVWGVSSGASKKKSRDRSKIKYIQCMLEGRYKRGLEANSRITEGKEFECMTSSRSLRGFKLFSSTKNGKQSKTFMCQICAYVRPWLQRGNQAALNSARELISPDQTRKEAKWRENEMEEDDSCHMYNINNR